MLPVFFRYSFLLSLILFLLLSLSPQSGCDAKKSFPYLVTLGDPDDGAVRPSNITNRTLVYIQFGKVGSTSFRGCFYTWEKKPFKGRQGFSRVTQVWQSRYGLCEVNKWADCSYVVILRDPIKRAISSWEYFCRDCEENKRFCTPVHPDRYDFQLHTQGSDPNEKQQVQMDVENTNTNTNTNSNSNSNSSNHNNNNNDNNNNKHVFKNAKCPSMSLKYWTYAWGNIYTMDLSGLALKVAGEVKGITPSQWINSYSRWVLDMKEVFPKGAHSLRKLEGEAALEAAKQKIRSGEIMPLIIEDLDDEVWQTYASSLGGIDAASLAAGCNEMKRNVNHKHQGEVEKLHNNTKMISELEKILQYDIELYKFARAYMNDNYRKKKPEAAEG